MAKKIFVGGMGGSGTRVIQMILSQAGEYYLGDCVNNYYDWMGHTWDFVKHFDNCFFRDQWQGFSDLLEVCTKGRDSWSLKHGHLMFCVDQLKRWYPDSKYIHVVRHPIDNMVNTYQTHMKYADEWSPKKDDYPDIQPRGDYPLQQKVEYYGRVNGAAIDLADLVVKLEDLCFKTDETAKTLLNFAEIFDYDKQIPRDIIQVPPSIGRGKAFYETISDPILKRLGYE